MNTTYQHIEEKIKVFGLTFGEIIWLFLTGITAFFLTDLSPLATDWTLSLISTFVGLSLAVFYFAKESDLRLGEMAKGVWSWWRHHDHYLPGTSQTDCHGYMIIDDTTNLPLPAKTPTKKPDLRELWH